MEEIFFILEFLNLCVCVHLTGLLHAAPQPLEEEEVARSLVLTAVLGAAGGLAAG